MNERIVLGLGGTVDYEIDWDDDEPRSEDE